MTKLCFISDTHTFHHKLQLPECDILIHSGDYSFTGDLLKVNDFLVWFSEQKCSHRIFINGNHEMGFWENPTLFEGLIPDNTTFLLDKSVTLGGLNFYGSPHTKEFCQWAYPYYNETEARKIWGKIPSDTDILITHQPPYKIRDGVPFVFGRDGSFVPSLNVGGDPQGCEVLLEKVKQVKPLIHVFGHIHPGSGYSEINGTLFINAAICDDSYKAVNPITTVTLDVGTKTIVEIVRE